MALTRSLPAANSFTYKFATGRLERSLPLTKKEKLHLRNIGKHSSTAPQAAHRTGAGLAEAQRSRTSPRRFAPGEAEATHPPPLLPYSRQDGHLAHCRTICTWHTFAGGSVVPLPGSGTGLCLDDMYLYLLSIITALEKSDRPLRGRTGLGPG